MKILFWGRNGERFVDAYGLPGNVLMLVAMRQTIAMLIDGGANFLAKSERLLASNSAP